MKIRRSHWLGYIPLSVLAVVSVTGPFFQLQIGDTSIFSWNFSLADILQIAALILAAFIGYWLAEHARRRTELHREYEHTVKPLKVLLSETLENGKGLVQREPKMDDPSFNKEIANFVNNSLKNFDQAYTKMRNKDFSIFPESLAAPFTESDAVNNSIHEALAAMRRSNTAMGKREKSLNWLKRDLIPKITDAIDSIERVYKLPRS
jgi:hypothetical protein